jgi:hypothetical protein
MNPSIVATIGAAIGILLALWQMANHLDKRNADRFDALQKQIDALQKQLDSRIDGLAQTLRAEMREMRAEIRLEIKEAMDRRVIPSR